MKSQTGLVAEHVRLQQWAEQIRSCQSRPEGMDAAIWCDQNGITKANYYYRLRRVRKACLTTIEKSEPSFAEWTVPMPLSKTEYVPVEPNMAAVLHSPNGFTLEISNSVEE
ncbi:hypothetical protein ADH76_25400 [Enterocloster clostridioformis]|uniref:IS66 family insertion sequence element accessory protein TnpA n=1 Tax=Enterocloster clostridioformis TaxID=1531 RepID=UPI00080C78C7|nr:hypothetical protein [Enterocloster clostridioformis]ANU49397.1 hypothetical protein A4V08_29790 [Lachnoclostridium sp. YL32]NDO31768.1 IS66 family insertion sequence element accessory protein TnpB [Enterocloster clostridioformis]OXE64265.1 hypothetical protein ADH76_25400 [Enterocloster clostridioformis]QQR01678.1 IS66 family insertion sequence element accessory protein TnpB [Enterocloster clostridioformis]